MKVSAGPWPRCPPGCCLFKQRSLSPLVVVSPGQNFSEWCKWRRLQMALSCTERCGVGSRWRSGVLMDALSKAPDKKPAATPPPHPNPSTPCLRNWEEAENKKLQLSNIHYNIQLAVGYFPTFFGLQPHFDITKFMWLDSCQSRCSSSDVLHHIEMLKCLNDVV